MTVRDARPGDPAATEGPVPIPAHRCPLCGGPNGCAVARAGTFDAPCWCSEVRVSPAALAALPAAAKGRACLCRDCATRGAA